MGFLAELIVGIIAFMPVIIFGMVFKIMIELMSKNKKSNSSHKDFNYENVKSKNINLKEKFLDSIQFEDSKNKKYKVNLEELSKFVKEGKNIIKSEEIFSKDFKNKSLNTFKELRDKGYSKDEAFRLLKNLKEDAKNKRENIENIINANKTTQEIKENSRNSTSMEDREKLVDKEFIRECESDFINYEDESADKDLLAFDEYDYVKFQIYKEIFDKPLSLR